MYFPSLTNHAEKQLQKGIRWQKENHLKEGGHHVIRVLLGIHFHRSNIGGNFRLRSFRIVARSLKSATLRFAFPAILGPLFATLLVAKALEALLGSALKLGVFREVTVDHRFQLRFLLIRQFKTAVSLMLYFKDL